MEGEKLNLSRITDILTEIEKQLGPLEKQQTAAREYLHLKDELKQVEVNAFLLEQEKQEEQQEKQTNFFLKIISAILAFFNRIIVDLFGGKGFSEMIK